MKLKRKILFPPLFCIFTFIFSLPVHTWGTAPFLNIPPLFLTVQDTAKKEFVHTDDTPLISQYQRVDSLIKKEKLVKQNNDSLSEGDSDSGGFNQEFTLPFELKPPTKKEIARFQALILKSVLAMKKKDYARARQALLLAEPTERLAQVYKAILLSQAYIQEKDFVHADSVLQGCLNWVGGSVWQNHLLNHRMQIFSQTQPTDSARREFYAQVVDAPVAGKFKTRFLYDLLKLQGFNGSPEGYENLLKTLVQFAPTDLRLDSLYQQLSPNVLPGKDYGVMQKLMLDLEIKQNNFESAIVRCNAMEKLAPNKTIKQELAWTGLNLLSKNKGYALAITAAEKFIENYGDTPEAILLIAKSYDKLHESRKALVFYDRFFEKYPKHEKTAEIYWLRAWDLESQGNYQEAMEYYFRELADFKSNKRGDWANFRIGLCYLKSGNAAAAVTAFHSIRGQINSNAYSAGLFWEAKSLQATGDSIAADAILIELVQKYPFQYYGHLARQALIDQDIWDDSLAIKNHLTPSNPAMIKAWMKKEMSGYKDRFENKFESEYLGIGKLLQYKLDTLALLTMQTVPAQIKSNPWFLFVYAKQFQQNQLWNESYRLSLQLSQKIPPDKWGQAPKDVLRLIFPRPYETNVQKYATRNRLDPAFIFALMRQESGFDREIKSGAGAVGLMQLMPATAKTVAKVEKVPNFTSYSLSDAELNIRLGTAYLRMLKKEYRNDAYFILANYNAGPEAAKRWQNGAAERPIEEVVEDISYWETRDYVKKVMGNYQTYRILWHTPNSSNSDFNNLRQ